ncbi:response regulator receiver protein [Altererythrobacter sp. B11]|uniref:response regulator n=1 Tax=Altererythrobacter sp. B11 TaxID=2060312 RepID=UPI000DC7084B|nr:response regulator [Altererythrobacter sp. B11]BBC73456.1 response regulator receiver protein [Altererythrobacter sp. B11]
MLIEDMCRDLGCEIRGPCSSLGAALEAAARGDFDVALVDMNLAGERADPLIAELANRSVPHAVISGGDGNGRGHLLSKPFSFDGLTAMLATLRSELPGRQGG